MSNTVNALALSARLMEVAAEAALKVGDYLGERATRRVEFDEKAGFFDPVTAFDREAERIIVEHILGAHGDSTIVGEEGGRRGDGAVHWYVDPIDGTNNFVTDLPFYCTSIGAELDGRLVAGVIYDPTRRELFAANLGGAFLNGRPIRSRGRADDSTALLVTSFPYSGGRTTDAAFDQFKHLVRSFRAVRRIDSAALELAYVACGRVDVAFGMSVSAWDVAAGLLIVQQAGGNYRTIEPNGAAPWLCPRYVASCPEFDYERSALKGALAELTSPTIPPAGGPAAHH